MFFWCALFPADLTQAKCELVTNTHFNTQVPHSVLNSYLIAGLSGSNMPNVCSQSSQPPVTDLFVDLQDGNRLLSLLELLTGKQYVSSLFVLVASFLFCTGQQMKVL
jgi:hypothetical protein